MFMVAYAAIDGIAVVGAVGGTSKMTEHASFHSVDLTTALPLDALRWNDMRIGVE